MKALTILFPALVFAAAGVGYFRARSAERARPLPAFAPPPGAQIEPLTSPLGELALSGRVVDVDSRPVAGVTVLVRSNDVPLWAETDADGAFRLEGLVAGPCDAALIKWGFPPQIAHLAAAEEGVELVIAPPLPAIEPLVGLSAGPVVGRVAHPIGGEYADALGYELQFEPRGPASRLSGATFRRSTADARGFFSLEDLAHGSYQVRVLPSWASGGSWPNLIAAADAQLDHEPGSDAFFVFGLEAGAIEASVFDADGDELEGVYAILCDAADASRVWPPRMTDAYGVLRFTDLPPGRYRLALRAGESAVQEVLVDVDAAQIARPELPRLTVRKR